MATEDDLQKTLLRIEKILSNCCPGTGVGSGGGGRSPTRRPNVAGGRSEDKQSRDSAKTFRATSVALEALEDSTDTLNNRFMGLSKTVRSTRENFISMNRSMRAATRGAPTARVTGGAQDTQGAPPGNTARTLLGQVLGSFGGRRSPLIQSLQSLDTSIKPAKLAFSAALWELASAVKPIINDFFELHRVGINGSAALGGMYLDAIKAGMSLGDYTKLLMENSNAVVRFGSMREFNNTVTRTNSQLGGLGIFGEEASKLSAALTSSTVSLGVPMSQMNGAMDAQIKIFGDLRKTSLLTAEGFQELASSLATNADVQAEMLGLNKAERAARFAELMQTQTLGLQMGMTKEASKQLGAALLETRKLTAVQRFGAAGRIRQAGAITGMGAEQTETLAKLARKKRRTPQEDAMFVQLGGELQAGIERMMGSGDINQENIAEQLQETLNATGIGKALEQAGQARLSQEAGPAGVNKDLQNGASELVKGAGMLLAYAQGLAKNPIASAITGAIGSSAFALGIGTVLGRILGKGGGIGGAIGAVTGAGGSVIDTGKKVINGAVDVVKSGISKIFNLITTPFKIGGGTGIFADLGKVGTFIKDTIGKIGGGLADFGGTFQKGVGKVGEVTLGVASWFKTTFGKVTGLFGDIAGKGKAIFTMAEQFVESSGGLLKVLGKGAGIFGKLLKGIPVIGNVISFFIDAIGEVFTGNVAAAFNEDGGGWLERIGGVVFAAINGIFGGIFGLVDSAIKFFGGEGFNLENAWEKFALVMKAGLMLALSKIVSVIPVVGDKASAYFEKSAEDSFAVLQQLEENKDATISSIGAKRNAELDKQKESAKKATDASTAATKSVVTAAGIVTTTQGLTQSLISTAKAVPGAVATAEAAKATMVATPGQTPRPAVTPPPVNTPTTTATTPTQDEKQKATTAAPTPTELLTAQFSKIIELLTQSLGVEQAQAAFMEAMARSAGRVPFMDNEQKVQPILQS